MSTAKPATRPYVVQRQLATATAVFRGDKIVAALPFQPTHAKRLGSRFGLHMQTIVPVEPQPLWRARKGVAAIGDRTLLIDDIYGNELQLLVAVDGETADAIDVLQEVWAALCEQGGEEPSAVGSLATLGFGTTAVVELPFTYQTLMPGAAVLEEYAARAIGWRGAPLGGSAFRFSMPVSLHIGTNDVLHEMVIEPRFTSAPKDRVYFTASPLKTEDHEAMLTALCDRMISASPK